MLSCPRLHPAAAAPVCSAPPQESDAHLRVAHSPIRMAVLGRHVLNVLST